MPSKMWGEFTASQILLATRYNVCNCLSMLGFKLYNVSKGGLRGLFNQQGLIK